MNENIHILKYTDVPLGGFAGIVEKQLVMNPKVWPQVAHKKNIRHGLNDFIYLAMGYFKPKDGAPMHSHENVDIVSFIHSGKIIHTGNLGDGTIIQSPGVQVQRAGTGIRHSEFNLTDDKAELVQIWFRPPENNLQPKYQEFPILDNQLTTVLGGNGGTFANTMNCQIGYLGSRETVKTNGKFVAILFDGKAKIDGNEICKGDLIEGENLELISLTRIGLIMIQKNKV